MGVADLVPGICEEEKSEKSMGKGEMEMREAQGD